MKSMAEPTNHEEQETEVDEALEADITTARGLLGSLILSPEAEQAVLKALSSSNPPKMLAMFLAQGIEMIQKRSMGTDTPLDPTIWLANGGVLDEVMVDIAEIAADNQVPFKIAQMLPAIKEAIVPVLGQRGEQLKQEGEQPPAQGQPPQAPMGPSNLAAPGGM